MFSALPPSPDLAIGWSLGGQLLVRAVAAGRVTPKALLLLGAPFQHVADAHFPQGVPLGAASEYRENYRHAPMETLKQFMGYIGYGDRFATRIIRSLNQHITLWDNGLFWLDELMRTSCRILDFSRFPKTILVHGTEDKVISPENAKAFKAKIPHAELLLWSDCGHAPHLHNPDVLRKVIANHV
jgi:pimeloyl-[acyl-carrier protein] methyl ester esterase